MTKIMDSLFSQVEQVFEKVYYTLKLTNFNTGKFATLQYK